MGIAEQKVSARDDGYGSRLSGVSMPAGKGGAGHEGVGVAAEDVDRARQRWFATVTVTGTNLQVVADERHQCGDPFRSNPGTSVISTAWCATTARPDSETRMGCSTPASLHASRTLNTTSLAYSWVV